MSSPKWVILNGVKYPVDEGNESPQEKKIIPEETGKDEVFIFEGCEWETVTDLTYEQAVAISAVLSKKL